MPTLLLLLMCQFYYPKKIGECVLEHSGFIISRGDYKQRSLNWILILVTFLEKNIEKNKTLASLIWHLNPNAQLIFMGHALNRDTIISTTAASSILEEKRKFWINICIGRYSKLQHRTLKTCIEPSLIIIILPLAMSIWTCIHSIMCTSAMICLCLT